MGFNKIFRVSALVVLCSIFSIFSGFSQVIQGKGWSLSVRVPYNTAEEFKAENTTVFNNFLRPRNALIQDGVKRIHLEHIVINKGESSRIGIIFNGRGSTKTVERIVIEGVGETTPEDINNGSFVVTVNPEKSTLYRISTYAKDSTGKVECYKENRRLVVVDVSSAIFCGSFCSATTLPVTMYSTLVFNTSAKAIRLYPSGALTSVSHLDTDCLVTPILSAISS